MHPRLLSIAAGLLLSMAAVAAEPSDTILALERQAMDGLAKGNPDPALALFDPEISWFHVMTEKRLDGLPAVKAVYESYRGRPLFESYDIVAPKTQANGDVAVLTYQLAAHNAGATTLWNATQVYQRKKEGWRVVHSHWSAVK